ncbi:MAG: transcriptional regulator [Hyphomicrobiales bacterium]|nr:transcriptional regulator [Hyphomicrobiales bacterium]
MATDSRTPESAEARQKKKALQAVEGQKAMVEYEAGLRQMREKTERLRALRLARDEAEAKLAAEAPPAAKKKTAKKKTAKAAKVDEADEEAGAESVS